VIFSSIEFLALFLPAFLLAYMATPAAWRNLTLCIGSWIFYSWWKPVFLLVIVGVTFIAWAMGRAVERAGERTKPRLVACGVVIILGVLGWFKYANLMVETLNDGLRLFAAAPLPWSDIILPIALSFTALQGISYLIDVKRGTVAAEPRFVNFAAYLDMFPHLIAGPIIRYAWIAQEIRQRRVTLDDVAAGARRFMLGFAMKVLIADSLAPLVEAAFALPQPSLCDAWLGNVAFALQIFFDFAGYSAMAIGLARILGFHYPENFRDPYLATSIQDFWRRWHISLSSWLRDYLYISLGGNRRGPVRTYVNLILTMAIGGLWHGASWAFLLWGLIHGFALAIARAWSERGLRLPSPVSYLLTLAVVLLAWTPFRAKSWDSAVDMLAGQFGLHGMALGDQMELALRPVAVAWLLIGIGTVLWPVIRARLPAWTSHQPDWWAALWPIALFLYAIAAMMGRQTVPFLYFQF